MLGMLLNTQQKSIISTLSDVVCYWAKRHLHIVKSIPEGWLLDRDSRSRNTDLREGRRLVAVSPRSLFWNAGRA